MKFLARITRMSMPVALVLSVAVLCGWIPEFLNGDWRQVLPTMLLVVVNGVMFWYLTVCARLTRDRDGLPLFIYLLSATAFLAANGCWQGQTAVLCMLLVLLLLRKAFREDEPTESAFVAALLLSGASLVLPDMVWLIPAVWVAYILLHSFGLRVWLATLIGAAVFAVYFVLAWHFGWIENVYMPMFDRSWLFSALPLSEAIKEVSLIGIGIVLFVASLVRTDRDSTGQQNWLLLFTLFFIVAGGLSLFPMRTAATACCGSLLPVALLLFSGLWVLFFRQRESAARGIMYIIGLILLVVCYWI